MTHRLLAACFKYTPKPEWSPAHVANIANNCNNKEIQAKSAQKASFDLFLNYYIEWHRPYVQTGVVCRVKKQSFDVIVLKTRSTVRIYTNTFDDEWVWTSERVDGNENSRSWRMQIKFPKSITEPEDSIVVDLFSLVRVELAKCARSNQLKAKLCRP
jgi:exoribonuclease R